MQMRSAVGSVVAVLAVSVVRADGDNLARGRPYEFSRTPDYELSRDAGDRVQLTDGETVKGHFWTQKGTVGWNMGSSGSVRTVTVDLGEDSLISGFSWDFAAGVAGVK